MPKHKIIKSLESLAVEVDKINLNPKNTKIHNDANVREIAKSLSTFGQRKPIVVARETGYIEAGNGTYLAAQLLGWSHIAAVYVDDDHRQAMAYGVADNVTPSGDWDYMNLSDVFESFDSAPDEIAGVTFDFVAEVQDVVNMANSFDDAMRDKDAERLGKFSKTVQKKRQIKPVLYIEHLEVFERALKATGNDNRAEALQEICQAYLDSAGAIEL